jgi:superfamily II DNA or RNA helicase
VEDPLKDLSGHRKRNGETVGGNVIDLRPYQLPAVHALAKCDLGYIKAPAGSGKTIIAASALRRREDYEARTYRVLWIAYTRELLAQGEVACKACGVQSEVDYRCMQGLTAKDLESYDLVIVDECHHVASPESKKVMRGTLFWAGSSGSFSRRCIVWGLSATPLREDGEGIEPIIGPCVYEVPPEAVAEAGGVLPAVVRVVEYHDAGLADKVRECAAKEIRGWMSDEQANRVVWRHVLRLGVTENRARFDLIADIANWENAAGNSVIVLCDTVDMCKAVEALLESGAAVYAAMGKKRRAAALDAFKRGEILTICATAIADEGLDVPIASVLILARAGKAEGKLTQRVGRVLRPYPGQTCGVVYDIKDTGHGMLTAQFWRRLRLYKGMGFSIEQDPRKSAMKGK